MSKVIIVGGGAAGMMAAITAARNGNSVLRLEKNEKLGKKIYITGKGRCNLTNAGDNEDLMNSIVTNQKFMYGAFSRFSNYDCMGFFDELGLKFKVERGNRVFPESDKASDVIDCLRRELRRHNVSVEYETEVKKITAHTAKNPDSDGSTTLVTGVDAITRGKKRHYDCDELIVATGGCSYPTTGSTGDGYRFAEELGVRVTDVIPALVPVIAKEEWVKELQGLSLKNIAITVCDGSKEVYSDFGEMMFTHFGVTGPVILSASSYIAKRLRRHELKLVIDLKPALDNEQLDERICRDFEEFRNKQFANSLDKLLPKKMIPVIVELSGIDPAQKVNSITAASRKQLVQLFKNLTVTITGVRGFNEAIITQGGIDVREINPSTMQCKKIPNLRFAGEVLDVDAVTGGFNLQVAWSTAYTAGQLGQQNQNKY